MKEQLISVETAKLAKEKGFKIKTNKGFCDENKEGNIRSLDCYGYYDFNSITKESRAVGHDCWPACWGNMHSQCTQSLLQKWLREEHLIHIELKFDTIAYGYRIFNPFKVSDFFTTWNWSGKWDYEGALEQALLEGLKLIQQK